MSITCIMDVALRSSCTLRPSPAPPWPGTTLPVAKPKDRRRPKSSAFSKSAGRPLSLGGATWWGTCRPGGPGGPPSPWRSQPCSHLPGPTRCGSSCGFQHRQPDFSIESHEILQGAEWFLTMRSDHHQTPPPELPHQSL